MGSRELSSVFFPWDFLWCQKFTEVLVPQFSSRSGTWRFQNLWNNEREQLVSLLAGCAQRLLPERSCSICYQFLSSDNSSRVSRLLEAVFATIHFSSPMTTAIAACTDLVCGFLNILLLHILKKLIIYPFQLFTSSRI